MTTKNFELLKKSAITDIASDLESQVQSQLSQWEATRGLTESGDFDTGFTATERQQIFLYNGEWYRWDGVLPKTVSAGSTPTGTGGVGSGAWLSVGDATLRSDLANPNKGALMVRGAVIYVDTIADLQALDTSALVDGQIASVYGSEFRFGGGLWEPTGKIDIRAFGAIGDGLADDRAAVQAALDFIAQREHVGGELFFPEGGVYRIASTHPDYPDHGLVFEPEGNIYLRGKLKMYSPGKQSAQLKLDVPSNITSLFYVPIRSPWMDIQGMLFDANDKADYAFKANDDYNPYMNLYGCRFQKGNVAAALIATYVSHIEQCHFVLSHDGLQVWLGDGTGSDVNTSITLTATYALSNRNIGFNMGFLTYCTFNSCACDDALIGYRFKTAYGVVMNASGAERVRKPFLAEVYRGFAINTFYMLSCGSADPNDPTDYLFEFHQGAAATIQGVLNQYSSPRYYDYILGVTSSNFGSENVTVLDGSLDRYNIYQVSSSFERPIKLMMGDESFGDYTYSIADSAALDDWFKRFDNYTINHNVTLQLASGTYIITDQIEAHLKNIDGSGRLTLQGQSDRSLVVLKAPVGGLSFRDIKCDLSIRNLTIGSNVANSTASRVNFINCNNAILDNVLITADGQVTGYASILNGSNLKLINGTIATGGYSQKPFAIDAESSIKMTPSDTPPATGAWTAGMIQDRVTFTAGGSVGFVCITTGDPATWKGYGAIDA